MKTNANDPSTPLSEHILSNAVHGQYGSENVNINPLGLTKREHFAAMAMQGLLANASAIDYDIDGLSEMSVQAADALITALNK